MSCDTETYHYKNLHVNVPIDWNSVNPRLNTNANSVKSSPNVFKFGPIPMPVDVIFSGSPVEVFLTQFVMKPVSLNCVVNNTTGRSCPIPSVVMSLNYGGNVNKHSNSTVYSGKIIQNSSQPSLFGGNITDASTGGSISIPLDSYVNTIVDGSGNTLFDNKIVNSGLSEPIAIIDGGFKNISGSVYLLVTDPEADGATGKNATHKLWPFIYDFGLDGHSKTTCLEFTLNFRWKETTVACPPLDYSVQTKPSNAPAYHIN